MPRVERVRTGPLETNCYVVSGEAAEAIVIDPGDDFERIAAHLDAASLAVRAVFATHAHYDHVGAVARLAEMHDAPFYAHPADSRLLPQLNFYRWACHRAERVPIPKIDIPLDDAMTIRFGEFDVEVLHTPGHTCGSVCLRVRDELFTGDTFLRGRLGYNGKPEGDREALLASASRLTRGLPSDTRLWPGHGDPMRLREMAEASRGAPG